VLNLSRRFVQLGVAILLMTLVRAHIAVMVVASLALAAAAYRGFSLGRRLALLAPAGAALAFLATTVQSYLGVNIADAGSVTTYLEARTALPMAAQGNTNLSGASFLARLASLLFRPMFYDARNALGIVASLENCVILLVIAYCFAHSRQLVDLYRKVFFIRFAVIFSLILTVLLAMVNYNVGLGLRQRTMILPPLLSIFVSLWALRMRLKLGPPATIGAPLPSQVAMTPTAPAIRRSPNV
jgi:hypothetical protein